MPSLIKIHRWDGGSGFNDRELILSYCKEEPFEILKKILYSNISVYKYKDCYMPIDTRYPNNVFGLIIMEVSKDENEAIGIEIVGSFDDLDLSEVTTDNHRNNEIINEALERIEYRMLFRYNHCYDEGYELEMKSIIDEIKNAMEDDKNV